MKKFILGIIAGAVLFVPVTAWATHEHDRPHANVFLDIPYEPNTVAVFDDQDNKCYIVRGGYPSGAQARTLDISCVKR